MDIFHEPNRHLRYLRQSLAQNNESIGFFISAGCPLSVSMPDGEWPLIPDVMNLTKHINACLKDDSVYSKLINEISKAGKNVNNIEDILSFVRSLILVSKGGEVRGLKEKDLESVEKKICEEIVKKINVQLPGTDTPYHRICNWIRSIDRKRAIEVFTTNYDLLLEQSLEDNQAPYFDGFVGARCSFFDLQALEDDQIPVHWTRLWKIHGSINWHQEVKNNQKIVYRASEVKSDASHLIYPSHLKYEESRKMPYLALIDQLSRFIRRKSSFIILCGYSFNDGHLNDTLINALKANPTAMALGLMFGEYCDDLGVERYPEAYRLAKSQHNLNIWTNDQAIIGTNHRPWGATSMDDELDIELRQFVNKTAGADGANKSTIKLGDFNNFTNFLKVIIGSPPVGGQHG